MKKDWNTVKKFAAYRGLDEVPTNFPKDPDPELDESTLKKVLDEIFTVDPDSGFPRGDIQYYMSAEGNPQVKQWLENNILKPRLSGGQTMEGLTDDLIVEMSQRKDETIQQYTERVRGIYDAANAKINEFNAQIEKLKNQPKVE